MLEVAHAAVVQHLVVDAELAGELARGLGEDHVGRLPHDLRRAAGPHHRIAAQQIADCGRGDGGARPQRIDRHASSLQFGRQAEHAHAHTEFRHGVGGGMLKPFGFHVERWRQHKDVRVLGFLQVRNTIFRHHEGAARVDAHHQIEALHVGHLRVGQADGAGVVDANIDAAEFGDGLVDGGDHLGLFADIAKDRQGLAASGADLFGSGVDGALEFRMRLRGLCGDRDVGAVPRRAQRDRKSNAPTAAGYEQRLAFEGRHEAKSPLISSQ